MSYVKYLDHYVHSDKTLKYGSPKSACCDVTASIQEPYFLFPSKRVKIPTGICINGGENSKTWYRINGRSGLATNHGIIPIGGIIDADYTGEVFVTLLNTNAIIPRYIGLYNKCQLKVSGNYVSVIYAKSTKVCNVNNVFVNCTKEDITVYLEEGCEVVVQAGNAFRITTGCVSTFEYAFRINPGDAIAQLESVHLYQDTFIKASNEVWEGIVKDSKRKDGGFGSTGS